MAALTVNRNTPQRLDPAPVARVWGAGANQKLFAGALAMRNAAGWIVAGQTATGLVGVGRNEEYLDNSAGAAGALSAVIQPGVHRFDNLAADAVTIADIGSVCYAVDDQTVARTSDTDTRSPAGIVDDIDDMGVWVRFDEALTKAMLS